MIKLWRNSPVHQKFKTNNQRFPLKNIFPSGREAISYALLHSGLGRQDRIALPEWSSHCVVNAAAKYCTPIPLKEVVRHKIKVEAVLIYEQWGWPIRKEVLRQLEKHFKKSVFILDRVDSSHFKKIKLPKLNFKKFFQIISLSKLLGLPLGGFLIHNNRYLSLKSFYQPKNYKLKRIEAWLKKNDLLGAIETERKTRQDNLQCLLEAGFSCRWPDWMKKAIEAGIGPTIAPLFKGVDPKKLEKIKRHLFKNNNIETEIYHFDWAGNPLRPQYERCLAFPVHSSVKNIKKYLQSIKLFR